MRISESSFLFRIQIALSIIIFFTYCSKEEASTPASELDDNAQDTTQTIIVDFMPDSCLLIPLGQLTQKGSTVEIFIEDSLIVYDTLNDRLGGFWAIIPDTLFTAPQSVLRINITKRKTELQLIAMTNDSTDAYLRSSDYINWNLLDIINTARDIVDSEATNTQNALAIQEFVINNISFDDTYSDRYGHFTALQTLVDKKGVCINFSRLFVALCRAAGIPSRSVSGVIFLDGEPGEDCFMHHQWCEYVDNNNNWRSLDLTFSQDFDINDIRYIDFTYCAEETELFYNYSLKFHADPAIPFTTDNECQVIYYYLPTLNNARFGFQLLESNSSDDIMFQKNISIQKSLNGLTIN